ncbi:MAG: holo-ACP synthase [Sulfuriferula sp.]
MIYGVGTDMVAVARMARLLARYGEHAVQRILAPQEWPEFARKSDGARFLAKRFAAKEALAKAAGTGLRSPVGLSNIRVQHTSLGQPELVFATELQTWMTTRGVTRAHLSISDETDYVIAFVILETTP